jgi:hypothetical protein
MYSANYDPLLRATLDQGGLTMDDVKSPTSRTMRTPPIGGTGDFIGGAAFRDQPAE